MSYTFTKNSTIKIADTVRRVQNQPTSSGRDSSRRRPSTPSIPGSSAVILELGSVLEYNDDLQRYTYTATAFVSLDDSTGTACYAIPVCEGVENTDNIIPATLTFTGFSTDYILDTPYDDKAVYMFDYTRWL